ncbi:Dabb family protein [uncultured Leifsonia sp.]|uniref:Dabb family protein n=1 Tax=Leifsonia sp. TaxID=1870902 RepID=UPI0028D26B65|nr:Dabb family protein [uncultured Leifsonia sp.]
MTIRHVVSWKLATTDETERAEQAARIKAGLESLPAEIPEILSLEVGVNALLPGDNFDVVLISDFADADALDRYVQAPAHQTVAAYIRSVTAARSAVDFPA